MCTDRMLYGLPVVKGEPSLRAGPVVEVPVFLLVPTPASVAVTAAFIHIWSTHTSYKLFDWHDTFALTAPAPVMNICTPFPHSTVGADPLSTDDPSVPLPLHPLAV